VFVDTGSDCNTTSRILFKQSINRGLVSEFINGPETRVRSSISGEKAKMEVDISTNMGIKTSIQEFLILEQQYGSSMAFIASREKL